MGVPFENDQIRGQIIFIQRPHPEPEDGQWAYAEQFATKSRRFELRMQGVLKIEVDEIFFGAELQEPTPIGFMLSAAVSVISAIVNSLSAARGVWNHTCPEHVVHENGDEERQHLVWPLFAADALICTPAGETPPDITKPIEETPLAEKQSVRFNTVDTFTFVYYSKYPDYLQWKLCNMPSAYMAYSFDDFLGSRPVNVVAYGLIDTSRGHTQANKRYLARLAISNAPRVIEGRDDSQDAAEAALS